MAASFFVTLVTFACRRAAATVAAGLLLTLLASLYVAQNFAMDSNSENLISSDVDWRKRQIEYDAAFPQRNAMTLVVIDGATPEIATEAASRLTMALAENAKRFPIVRHTEGSDFFARNGLLFLSLPKLRDTAKDLIDAQPFLGPLAADPSLRGIMDGFSAALLGVKNDAAKLEDLAQPFGTFSDTLERLARNERAFLSWQGLISGDTPTVRERRRLIEVQAALDFNALAAGAGASDTIRKTAADLGLTAENGVTVRLTGSVPIADEEFLTLTDRAALMAGLMVTAIFLMLWAAVRSMKIIAAILVTLFAGLAVSTAIGLAAIGQFNVISVAFIPLFVGLGVDFGIQYSVRYRHERQGAAGLDEALARAGHVMGPPLMLAAAATAACFYSFTPTSFSGVAELGFIAGNGMVIAFLLSGTLLPALLKLLNPGTEAKEAGFPFLAPLDRFLSSHRKTIVTLGGVAAVCGLLLMPFLSFDANPLHLRNAGTESMATLFDLMKDPETAPERIDILAPSLAEAAALATRLEQLPTVDHATTLQNFVPGNQTEKLVLIADAAFLLDATINPFEEKPRPTPEGTRMAIVKTRDGLKEAAQGKTGPAAEAALRLAVSLDALLAGGEAAFAKAEAAMVPGLKTTLARMRASLGATPVDLNSLPDDLKRDWVASGGVARVQVSMKGNTNDNAEIARFAQEVRNLAPGATGAPVTTAEAGRTIVNAFIQAGLLSLIAVLGLLWIALRSFRDVVLTLGPLLVACVLTFATCVVFGLSINYANIIVLPLLLGIGVAFHIYLVIAWREGARSFLQSSLSRAVLFSALTTATGFGTLWLSRHPGTASMGELLMISLAWTLIVLMLLPALLEVSAAEK